MTRISNELMRRFHDPRHRIHARFVGIFAMFACCMILVLMDPPHRRLGSSLKHLQPVVPLQENSTAAGNMQGATPDEVSLISRAATRTAMGSTPLDSDGAETRRIHVLPHGYRSIVRPYRPAAIQRRLEEVEAKGGAGGGGAATIGGSGEADRNSVPIAADDLERAKANLIAALPDAVAIGGRGSPCDGLATCRVWGALWDAVPLGDVIARAADDRFPLIADLLGGDRSWAALVARLAPTATVVSVRDEVDVLLPEPLRAAWPRSRNLIRIDRSAASIASTGVGGDASPWLLGLGPSHAVTGDKRERKAAAAAAAAINPFGGFFTTCNAVSVATVFDAALAAGAREAVTPASRVRRLGAVFAALPQSRHTLTLLRPSELNTVAAAVGTRTGAVLNPPDGLDRVWAGTVTAMRVNITPLATICPDTVDAAVAASPATLRDDTGCAIMVDMHTVHAERACAKTWNAPLVQWGRRLVVSLDAGGAVAFRVESAADAQSGGKGEAGAGRRIDALQYIPSTNLDTLLGAGVSIEQRVRWFAAMVATPRYSDPLPHNWVVGLGGRVLRIDKVDLRYDSRVDEGQAWWGRSTRGYLRLLAYHMCLPILAAPDAAIAKSWAGIPVAFVAEPVCRTACERCASSACSYLPKGTAPCGDCLGCSRCVDDNAGRIAKVIADGSALAPGEIQGWDAGGKAVKGEDGHKVVGDFDTCQRGYSSLSHGRRVWARWRRASADP